MNAQRLVPFAYGFRPFFLAVLAFAPLTVGMWLWIRASGSLPLREVPPQLWHGHEMIFGIVAASIAGFLLTAVPNWTGTSAAKGPQLVALFIVWLGARMAFAPALRASWSLLLILELSFIPGLVALIAPPLLRTRHRNRSLLVMIGLLWFADAIFLYALIRADAPLATTVLRASINVLLLLVTVIAGRIIPAFTANALRRRAITDEVRSKQWIEVAVIASMALVVVVDIAFPLGALAATIAGLASLAHLLRLAGWRSLRTMSEPILWILHVAYAWIPIGLGLKAIQIASGAPWSEHWLHALTMGAIALMIVAVITRVSLGHTGRSLQVSQWTALAYVLLILAVLVRITGAMPWVPHYEWTIRIAGGLWIVAFAMILAIYAPMLLRPRVDGKAG